MEEEKQEERKEGGKGKKRGGTILERKVRKVGKRKGRRERKNNRAGVLPPAPLRDGVLCGCRHAVCRRSHQVPPAPLPPLAAPIRRPRPHFADAARVRRGPPSPVVLRPPFLGLREREHERGLGKAHRTKEYSSSECARAHKDQSDRAKVLDSLLLPPSPLLFSYPPPLLSSPTRPPLLSRPKQLRMIPFQPLSSPSSARCPSVWLRTPCIPLPSTHQPILPSSLLPHSPSSPSSAHRPSLPLQRPSKVTLPLPTTSQPPHFPHRQSHAHLFNTCSTSAINSLATTVELIHLTDFCNITDIGHRCRATPPPCTREDYHGRDTTNYSDMGVTCKQSGRE